MAQKETAVALPAQTPAGEPGVIKAFFWLWGKRQWIWANEWNKPAAYIGN